MTNNNSDFLQHNGLSVAPVFLDFVETSVIPATSVSAANFWHAFASMVATANTDKLTSAPETAIPQSGTTIPVRVLPDVVDTTWGSLYDALYHDNVIPHTTGLKPGSNINMARRDRVVRCAKDFLDKTFPLSEGSHRDAVSYMAYYQNLLVILADGTTTGLRSPKQFVAKNGPSDSPDSITLEHNGARTEILFDCNGTNGTTDLACIEDIQLETTQTIFDFEAGSAGEKCSVYKNWIAIVTNQRNTQQTSRSCYRAITTSGTNAQCTLVRDQNGKPVPDAVIDAAIAAIIETAYRDNTTRFNLCFADASSVANNAFVTELEYLLCRINPNQEEFSVKTTVKGSSASADIRANSEFHAYSSTPDSRNVSIPATATIDTMHSHGYDLTLASSL